MKLELEISEVTLFENPNTTDLLTLRPRDSKHILQQVVGTEIAQKVWGNSFTLSVQTTKGCGEALARALGLKITNRVRG